MTRVTYRRFSVWLVACVVVVLIAGTPSPAPAAMVSFSLMIADGENEGFNDPTVVGNTTLGAMRVSAMNFAAGIWSSHLSASYDNEFVVIRATMDLLGETTLGSTRSEANFHGFGSTHPRYNAQASYGSALANHLKAADLDTNSSEMRVALNSNTDWYYGTDGMPPEGKVDFVSVALHEIAHGLNFESRANFDPTQGASFTDNRPGIYDRFLLELTPNKFLRDMGIIALQSALVSDDVYWDGAAGKAANNNQRPRIYAPEPYQEGSSIAHIDPNVHADDLMVPGGTDVDHTPTAIDLGILHDMGWDVIPEPSALFLALVALAGVAGRRRAGA